MYHIILELYWFNITDNSSSVPICDNCYHLAKLQYDSERPYCCCLLPKEVKNTDHTLYSLNFTMGREMSPKITPSSWGSGPTLNT